MATIRESSQVLQLWTLDTGRNLNRTLENSDISHSSQPGRGTVNRNKIVGSVVRPKPNGLRRRLGLSLRPRPLSADIDAFLFSYTYSSMESQSSSDKLQKVLDRLDGFGTDFSQFNSKVDGLRSDVTSLSKKVGSMDMDVGRLVEMSAR